MTKVTILGEAQGVETEKKKIEFIEVCSDNQWRAASCKPHDYNNIEVVSLNFTNEYDLFFAYDNIRSGGELFLGHFNDGVV